MDTEIIFDCSEKLNESEKKDLRFFYSLISSPEDRQKQIFDFLKNNDIEGENLSQVCKLWFIHIKEAYREVLDENPALIFVLYKTIQYLTFDDFKSVFPSERSVIEQNAFDFSTEIFKAKNNDEKIANFAKNFIASAFSKQNIEKNSSEKFDDDLCLLQKIFFFLLWDIAEKLPDYDSEIFTACLKDKSWYSAEKLSEIFNTLIPKCHFNKRKNKEIKEDITVQIEDFIKQKEIHFEKNEGILRLIHNFTRPETSIKEGIINELNFIREQQKAILPVFPNMRKDNYKPGVAKKEISDAKTNLAALKRLDIGFKDDDFSQAFLINDEDRSKTFVRPIQCKCFQEAEMEWDSLYSKGGRIYGDRKERNIIKKSLKSKFLYPERNKVTHVGENFAVYSLFTKDYKEKDKEYWEELVLQSFWDAKQYLEDFSNREVSKSLLRILNYFFEKVVSGLDIKYDDVSVLWKMIFQNGEINIEYSRLKDTNMFNNLNERELSYLKCFMGFLYCSENVTEDFIIRNKTKIQVYLIYLSLEINKLDK